MCANPYVFILLLPKNSQAVIVKLQEQKRRDKSNEMFTQT